MKSRFEIIILFLITIFVISCSGGSGPVTPAETPLTGPATCDAVNINTSAQVWGIWEISIDPDAGTIESVPLRGAMFTANVVRFIDGPPLNLILNLGTVDTQPDYITIPVDVGLRHPFPGLDVYTGFDVIGIFMGQGDTAYPGDDLNYGGEAVQHLTNPDGYTRWFNNPEFGSLGSVTPLLGYSPGKLGTPGFYPDATLNPYKYFTDGLDTDENAYDFLVANASDRGKFTPGTVNTRHYNIKFPTGGGVTFQYAVAARWEENVNHPNPPAVLDDFPYSANAPESLVIDYDSAATTAWFAGPGDFGGTIEFDLNVIDHHKTSTWEDDFTVTCYSDAWSGGVSAATAPVGQGENYWTMNFAAGVENLLSADPVPVWIEISYPGLDYSNPFGAANDCEGTLSSYFKIDVEVDNQAPDEPWIQVLIPNGGEEWPVLSSQEITWNSNLVPGTVYIEYSKDNFVSDTNTIDTGVANTGSYIWDPVPNDPSETVRIRITATDDPAVSDISDADFSLLGEWLEVTDPNGGENAYIGLDYDITWDYAPSVSDVMIEYSTDSGATYPNMIIASTPCDGTYEWPVPDDPTDTARIRITSVADGTVLDESDDDFSIMELPDNFIYGISDNGFNTDADQPDNDDFFTNLLNLPLSGEYADNTKVLWWYGPTGDDYYCDWPSNSLIDLVQGLGYTYEYHDNHPLDLTGYKMVVISFLFTKSTNTNLTAAEIQEIRDFVNGGGIAIILVDNTGLINYPGPLNNLTTELGLGFTYNAVNCEDHDDTNPLTDITADPVTQNVNQMLCNVGGAWNVTGPGVSLVRQEEDNSNPSDPIPELHLIVKSPITN